MQTVTMPGGCAAQGPFASAAKLLAAFQSGQLDSCTLPAPYSGIPSAISWAGTLPFKAPHAGANNTDAPPAVTNSGLQSQVQPWQGLLSYTLQQTMGVCCLMNALNSVTASCMVLKLCCSMNREAIEHTTCCAGCWRGGERCYWQGFLPNIHAAGVPCRRHTSVRRCA